MSSLPFTWFDLLLGCLILGSVVSGLRAGLARVVVGLVATLAGLLFGFWSYRLVGDKIRAYVGGEGIADILGFIIIFTAITLLGALIGALLSSVFKWIGLSWFNHFLGGVAGVLRGVLVVAGISAVVVAFAPSPLPAAVAQSRLLPYATQVAAALAEAAPHDLKDSFLQQWENLKRFWAHPDRSSGLRQA